VSRNEKRDHVNEHYCLASVKNARNFASVFADQSVILSQDDKAKVSVGIPAIGRHFKTMQTILEPVSVPDHDFPIGSSQKLVPSVYLLINPKETDESLRVGQLLIFIRAQWHLGSSSATHMTDILSLVSNKRPDENPRHSKNIVQYCKLFCFLNLDYLTIRTLAPGQLAYNPVERSMSSLSKKVAGITLPIDHFGNHLDSQGNVQDYELGLQNFRYAGQALADLWRRDLIYGKPVFAEYVDGQTNPFSNILSSINENELENKKNEENSENNDNLLCHGLGLKEAVALLSASNGFLPPLIKGKDGHYLNAIHTLEHCCTICKKYFPTIFFLTKHRKFAHPSTQGRRPGKKQPRSNSVTVEDFSMLSSSLGITDHESIAIAIALGYVSD
ncbi:23633_t:CDS:2, partial [Gigaspora margarita]